MSERQPIDLKQAILGNSYSIQAIFELLIEKNIITEKEIEDKVAQLAGGIGQEEN